MKKLLVLASALSLVITFGVHPNASLAAETGAEVCKLTDGQPEFLRGLPRGTVVNGQTARAAVGFPFDSGRFPVRGSANLIAVMVTFKDTKKFVDSPRKFLGPQTKKIRDWSKFWSQGKFTYEFQIIENWIELPINSSEAPSDDKLLAAMILEKFPKDVDFSNVDGTFIYWAPGIDGGKKHDFGLRVGSNEQSFLPNEQRPGLIWAPSQWHYENSGGRNGLKYKTKREYTWAYWVHELLHEQGLNLHAPGNGWATGVGQNQYPNPGMGGAFSAAMTGWESFLIGWLNDSQVFCVDATAPGTNFQVNLTPLEIYGGKKKVAVVKLSDTKALVVESRRPTGYTEKWKTSSKGVFVYLIDVATGEIDDHSPNDCGNDPAFTKWAYYLFPDGKKYPNSYCGSFDPALVKKGHSVTYRNLKISVTNTQARFDRIQIAKTSRKPVSRSELLIAHLPGITRKATLYSACSCCGCSPTPDFN